MAETFDQVLAEGVIGDGILVDDPFDDGSRFDSGDEADTDWYEVSGVSSLAVVDDASGLGSGNALEVTTSGNAKILGSFPPFHLAEIGQSLRLTVDFRLVSVTSGDEWLRFGLYDSRGTAFSRDSAGTEGDGDGYMVRISTGTGSDDLSIVGDPGELNGDTTSSILGGNGTDILAQDSGFDAINDTGPHQLEFTVTRWSSIAVSVEIELDGKILAGIDPDANNADGNVYFTFDEIAFSWQGAGDYIVDNILLESNVPEVTVVPITQELFTNVPCVLVNSQPGLGYEIESNSGPVSDGWAGVGYQVTGNGNIQRMYDPGAAAAAVVYRIRGRE